MSNEHNNPPVTCGNGCDCLAQCGDTYAHAGLPKPPETEKAATAPAVPLGYINAGHLHEMQSGRLPYAYLYAAPGVGVEIPVYTSNAPTVPQGWTKAADQVPLEADGEVFIRFTDGSIGTGWATYWHGASNEFAQWTFPDPDEDRTVLEWTKNPATPAPAPAQEVGLTDEWLLEQLKHYPNWELSTSNDPECDPSVLWLVHEVKGGRNDREWFLIGEGDSPRAAIIAALRAKGTV